MKLNVMRTLSFLLVCVMFFSLFVGCGNNEADTPTDVESTQSVASTIAPVIVDVDKDDPYTISKDANGKDIVILTPNADGSITMTVAEKTTLEAFLGCVVAKDGYVVKVTDVSGKEVTDKKALIAKDMVFEVVNEQSSESEIKLIINVVTQDVIQETVEEQEEINNNTNSVVSAPVKEPITKPEPPSVTVIATVSEAEVVEQPKPQIPPRPIMPPEAAAFPRLQKIKVTLDKHNNLIFETERERNKLEIELSDLKGLARLTKKKELESRIATKNEEIRTLKAGLSGIVRQHGFATVQDFYTAFYTAQRATDAYQKECAKWNEVYGEKVSPKAETMHEKIKRYQEKANQHNASQPYRGKDKGAR